MPSVAQRIVRGLVACFLNRFTAARQSHIVELRNDLAVRGLTYQRSFAAKMLQRPDVGRLDKQRFTGAHEVQNRLLSSYVQLGQCFGKFF